MNQGRNFDQNEVKDTVLWGQVHLRGARVRNVAEMSGGNTVKLRTGLGHSQRVPEIYYIRHSGVFVQHICTEREQTEQ